MSDRKFLVLCLVGWFLGAWVVTLPLGLHFGSMVLQSENVGRGLPEGDQAFFVHSLWWVGESVFRSHEHPWFSPYMAAPEGISLFFSSLVPFLGILSFPLSFVLNWIAIYNVWVVISIALTAFLTQLVLFQLNRSRTGSVVAGLLLFYPSFLQEHVGHLNLLSAYWIPGVYFSCLRFYATRKRRWAIIAGLGLGLIFYVSAYHTVHLSLLLMLDVSWRFWRDRSEGLRKFGRLFALLFIGGVVSGILLLSLSLKLGAVVLVLALGIGAAVLLTDVVRQREERYIIRGGTLGLLVALLLVSPFVLVGISDSRVQKSGVRVEITSKAFWSAQPLSYVLSGAPTRYFVEQGYLGGQDLYHLKAEGEFRNFPGYAFWGFLALILITTKGTNPWRRWLLWAGVFALLSFGPILRWGKEVTASWLPLGLIYLPGFLFDRVPLLDGYRVFSRMGFLFFFTLAVFMGLTWPLSLGRIGVWKRWAEWTLIAFFAIVVFAERIRLPAPVQEIRIPPLYERLAAVEGPLTLLEILLGVFRTNSCNRFVALQNCIDVSNFRGLHLYPVGRAGPLPPR